MLREAKILPTTYKTLICGHASFCFIIFYLYRCLQGMTCVQSLPCWCVIDCICFCPRCFILLLTYLAKLTVGVQSALTATAINLVRRTNYETIYRLSEDVMFNELYCRDANGSAAAHISKRNWEKAHADISAVPPSFTQSRFCKNDTLGRPTLLILI